MYGNVTDFLAYADERGNPSVAAATVGVRGVALQRATDYIRTRYVIRFLAEYDETDARVIEATYIAAQYELDQDGTLLAFPGFWSKTYTPSQTKVLTKAGSIAWTPLGDTKNPDAMIPTSTAIDALLTPITRYGMPAVRVV